MRAGAWWAALLAILPLMAHADRVGYRSVKDLRAESAGVVAEHHHDWSARTGFVRIVDVASGREILHRTSPPLTTLWLSPDGRYLVGLSEIKLANPTQLFIVSRDGSFTYEAHIGCDDTRLAASGCHQSVSNFVYWYDADTPALELTESEGKPTALSLNGPRPRGCAPGACAPRRIQLSLTTPR